MASSSSSHRRTEENEAFSGIEPQGKGRKVEESSRLCDVFINHRGPDVKQTVALQLYNILTELGIHAFLDSEEKELGESFPSTIENAIHSASAHIAIFSNGYAESPWCLAELLLMLQSRGKIVPVFYGVKPSDLRHIESGEYAKAFTKYEEKKRYMEKLKDWKEALQFVSFITGHEISNNFNISDYENIVLAVDREVRRTKSLHVAKYPVGLHRLVKDIERQCLYKVVEDFDRHCRINEGGKEKAQIVGIFGMGGVGKTTLAKELFNRKRSQYTKACFLFDVREAYARNEFPSLQREFLEDLFQKDRFNFRSTKEGKSLIADCIERSNQPSFLIVLDDIDHGQQLDALLIMEMLKKSVNSLVIVTTCDVGVLINTGITAAYNLKGMNRDDARELFCWHAFRQPHPANDYQNLVNSFLDVCGGLPLSLQVLGSHVHGRDQSYWSLQLNKVSKTLPRDIHKRLKISFDALDYEEQQIFMDIACFFIDKGKSIAMEVWEASGWSAQHALQTLKNKCLVQEIEGGCVLRMHDHLRDLGREIANELSHPRRLWRPQDLQYLEAKGFKQILAATEGRCLYSFKDLFLKTRITCFIAGLYYFAETELLWLDIDNEDGNLKYIPSWIPLQNLHGLTVRKMEEFWTTFQQQLQTNTQPPLQLRELRIIQCSNIQRFPTSNVQRFSTSIKRLRHLKKISLGFHGSFLPEELCALQSLEHLELSSCPMLSSLPPRFGDLRNLQYVDLSNCGQLKELPHSFQQLVRLEYLRLSCCSKLKLRLDMLKNITTLEYLDLTSCHELEELPHLTTNQASLRTLFVEGTSISEVPTNIGELHNLKELRIGSPMLISLPSSLGKLSRLNSLLIDGCLQLDYLPSSVCLLDLLKEVRIRASGLRELPFDAGSSNIEVTGQQASNSARNLRPSIKEHGNLQTYSPNKLPASLETLSLVANPQLMEIRILPQSLTILEICVCKKLKNMSGIAGLVNLRRLEICSCPELDELPSFADLASLEEFKMQGCPKVEVIQGLEHCKSLQILTAELPLILICDTISTLKPCIFSMKECPWEMMIRGRVIYFGGPIEESLSLANLAVLRLEEDSDWDNITQDLFNTAFLWYEEENESNNVESGSSGVNASVGIVVRIAVCREGSSAFSEYCVGRRVGSNPNVKQRKAVLATGEDERVVAAFHKLIGLLE